ESVYAGIILLFSILGMERVKVNILEPDTRFEIKPFISVLTISVTIHFRISQILRWMVIWVSKPKNGMVSSANGNIPPPRRL
ncbi:hypothetical protein, partial [Gluconobacter kondonii]|uniref:hypothetical protein n=1 Tax=Gluconobacter kondonii TaxID=941463 RepID=UPI001C3FCB1B